MTSLFVKVEPNHLTSSFSSLPITSPKRKLLIDCQYTEEDDYQYLVSDQEWSQKKAEKLKEYERIALFTLVNSLHHYELSAIQNVEFVNNFFTEYFNVDMINQLTLEKRKVEVRSIFIAAIVRELILRLENSHSGIIENPTIAINNTSLVTNRHNFLEKYPFLKNQEGNDSELTWLYRYERALRYLTPLMSPVGNKQYFLNVGAQLQGSDVFTEYITGGANRPETQRRVDIFENLTNVKPKPRAPRNMKKLLALQQQQEGIVKRGRGRPRKDQSNNNSPCHSTTSSSTSSFLKTKLTSVPTMIPPKSEPVKTVKTLKKTVSQHVMGVQKFQSAENFNSNMESRIQTGITNSSLYQINNPIEDDDLDLLNDEELLERLRSIDEETIAYGEEPTQPMEDITTTNSLNEHSIRMRQPGYYSQYFFPSCYSMNDGDASLNNDNYHFQIDNAASFYPTAPNNQEISLQYCSSAESMGSENTQIYLTNSPVAVIPDEITGKKRNLSLNDLDYEIEKFLMELENEDFDDDFDCQSRRKKLISLHRSRGFAKIPLADIPLMNNNTTQESEFPNRSIISYRFNIASVSSQDSTDLSTVESLEPEDDFDDDEIINDIDACFEGLAL